MYQRRDIEDSSSNREPGDGDGGVEDFEQLYEDVCLNCFRYFGFRTIAEVDRLTIPEYHLLEKAARLRETDKDYRTHQQAFLNFAVKAMKKSGKKKQKPVYSNFKKFFDYEKKIDEVLGRKKKDGLSGVREFMKRKGEAHGGKL